MAQRSNMASSCPSIRSAPLLPLLFFLLFAPLVSSLIDSLVCNDDYGDDDGIIVSPGSPTCFDHDRQALLMFKASIFSDPNHALSDWSLPNHRNCCEWNGVTCDGRTGRVVRLKLPDQNLKGTLAPELGALSHLQALILYNNELTGGIPSPLGNLTKLARLCLGSTSLTGTIPESFGHGLQSLQLLDISHSSLSGPLPASFGGMSSLGRLYLHHNQITGTFPPSFGRLSRVYEASFNNNKLSGLIPASFCSQLSTLISLYLDNNQITGLPADLRNCSILQYISLSGNPIRNADAVAGIVTAPMMMEIHLSSCKLKGQFPSWVANLPHYPNPQQFDDELWSMIDLSNNELSGEIPAAAIAALPSYIRTVALNNNRLKGRIPAAFANMSSLWGLLLQNNELTGTIPAAFAKLTQTLTSFNVSGNQLSGSIPPVSPFTTFATSAYKPGNPGLCGSPLPRCKGL